MCVCVCTKYRQYTKQTRKYKKRVELKSHVLV